MLSLIPGKQMFWVGSGQESAGAAYGRVME